MLVAEFFCAEIIMKPAIVVVAFNRPKSLGKLLHTISIADYDYQDITLVISIDYTEHAGHHEVVKIAEEFCWEYGDKKVIVHQENMGLRNHILSCGDMTKQYGAVIVLEDDLRVSEGFYRYAMEAAKFYYKESNIAGVSLYSYEYEELGWYKFYPKNIGGDTYFMQWASSWGQLWTDLQWSKFREWYCGDRILSHNKVPDKVKSWKKSWKKHYICYLAEKNLFFVYPYISYTTVRDALDEEKGVHHASDQRTSNVLLSRSIIKRDFVFSGFSQEDIKYDAFFQPTAKRVFVESLNEIVEVEFDLFGTKKKHNITSNYVCSTKSIARKVQTFSNKLIPYEDNILLNESGDMFSLGSRDGFIYHDEGIIPKGRNLYHSRKIFAIKEMLVTVVYRSLQKVFGI
jgi:hypothetical protein